MPDISLTSSEIGNLWQAYQEKSMKLLVLEHFISQSNDQEAQSILQSAYDIELKNQQSIKSIFENEGIAIPIAFTEADIDKNASPLFDDDFHIMYLRMLSKVLIGLYSLHCGMAYREDVFNLYKDLTSDSQTIYYNATQYLLNKGVMARPPFISTPTNTEFVEGTEYFSGMNPFEQRRPLDTVEIGLIYQSLETNITGMRLMAAYAQVAKDPEVKKYLSKGKELAKQNVQTMSELLLDDDIQAPSTWAGIVTDSTMPPFSDKLMMFNTNLFSMFGLGSNSVGTGFSFRGDIVAKMSRILVKTFNFSKDGGKIRAKKGWMEKPPYTVDHSKLAQKKD